MVSTMFALNLSVQPVCLSPEQCGHAIYCVATDSSFVYSGMAENLYEYVFDTILPKYTPLFEEELTSKTTMDETISEFYPYAIYPNPTSDFINIELDSKELNDGMIEFLEHYGMQDIEDCEIVTVSILDINGRMLQTQEFNYEDEIITVH